jgi:eukaryotic-like serine/threonine-protein kinase
MNQLRERWEGVALPGGYLLQPRLSGDEAAGFFETSLPSGGRRAIVKLAKESAGDGAAQLALWQRTRLLRHPNLGQLLDCGRAELGGETAVWAVFEYADDTLAAALGRAPLSEAEAREVLAAAVAALRYLRAEGLAHPALDPDHVVAVGESIKLSTDALREAAPDASYTDELRAFWFKISPSPLARSADILAQALGVDPHPGPKPAPPTAPTPAAGTAPAAPLPGDAAPAPARPFPKWILVGAAAVVLLILGLNLRPSAETPAQPAPAPAPVAEAPAPKAPAPIVAPEAAKPGPLAKPASKPAAEPVPARRGMWRVIAFTTRTREDAARKAGQVNQSHPDFAATVFTPPEKKGFFLVALGGRMSREDALRVQNKARAVRVSRDVYVKKFLD